MTFESFPNILQKVEGDYCKVIMMHNPARDLDGGICYNRDILGDACVTYDVDLILSGHLHEGYHSDYTADGFGDTKHFITPAFCQYDGYAKIYVSEVTGEITDVVPGSFNSRIGGDVSCRAQVHVYDNLGNHAGPDENGDIEVEIPGANYLFTALDTTETSDTFIEFSVYKTDTTDYLFTIESLSEDTMNVELFTNIKGGGLTIAYYDTILVFDGSVATVNADQSDFDYLMTIEDPEGTREILPSRLEQIPPFDTDIMFNFPPPTPIKKKPVGP